jgi:hypothetical protein
MSVAAHHLLLAAAALALGDAALRAVAPAAPRGLERLVAAAPVAASAAVLLALLLGAAGLGGSPAAVAVAIAIVWASAWRLLPAPRVRLRADVASWWERTPAAGRAVVLGLAGAGVAYVSWTFRNPVIGIDGVSYHLTESLAWLDDGRTGAVVDSYYGLPTGNYQLVTEVLGSLGMALSRSFVAPMLVTPAVVALTGLAGWLGLRRSGVPVIPAALALLALLSTPLVVQALDEPGTDLPATAWLVCAWALAVCAGRRPALLAPALLAAGLAVGTKTTVLPIAAIVLAIAALRAGPAQLHRLRVPLLVASGAALVVGGFWYARNLVTHGSPLWPFTAAPWGTDKPVLIDAIDYRLVDRPRATLDGHFGDYVDQVGGGFVLLAAALLAPLAVRRRQLWLMGAVTALGLALWTVAPVTGVGDVASLSGLPLTATRYLLPTLAVAAIAVALVGHDAGWRGGAAVVALAGAIGWSVAAESPFVYPRGPSVATLLLGAAAAVAAGFGLAALAGSARGAARAAPGWALGAVLAVAAAAALTPAANGYVERHAALRSTAYSDLVAWFADRPGFTGDDTPIRMAAARPAPLAGDRLKHPVDLIDRDASCAAVLVLRDSGWVILGDLRTEPIGGDRGGVFPDPGPASCLANVPPTARIGPYRVYSPR